MKKDNIIFLGLLGIVVLILSICAFFAYQKEEQIPDLTDAEKIAEEYKVLNNEINEQNNLAYPIVELSNENPFVYASEEEVIRVLKEGTGVIYFGFPSCPWCRTLLPVLESAAKEVGIGRIYYLNISEIRDTLELDENNKIVTTKEGSNGYYQILNLLDEYLEEYTLIGKNNERVTAEEKRLFAPTVVSVLNGEIVGFHEGTVSTQENGYAPLPEEETEDLKSTLSTLLEATLAGTCNEAC